jgi:hypothetical protein
MRNITAREVFEAIPVYMYIISIIFAMSSCYFPFRYFMNGRFWRIIEVLDHNLKNNFTVTRAIQRLSITLNINTVVLIVAKKRYVCL